MNYGRRTRVTPTRAGLVTETYFICYYCPSEFENEAEATSHACDNLATQATAEFMTYLGKASK